MSDISWSTNGGYDQHVCNALVMMDMQYPINNQSIKYLRLKNARRCIICHTPSESSATIVNQAKFCTRTFVDTKRGPRRSVVGGACDRKRLYCSCFEIAP